MPKRKEPEEESIFSKLESLPIKYLKEIAREEKMIGFGTKKKKRDLLYFVYQHFSKSMMKKYQFLFEEAEEEKANRYEIMTKTKEFKKNLNRLMIGDRIVVHVESDFNNLKDDHPKIWIDKQDDNDKNPIPSVTISDIQRAFPFGYIMVNPNEIRADMIPCFKMEPGVKYTLLYKKGCKHEFAAFAKVIDTCKLDKGNPKIKVQVEKMILEPNAKYHIDWDISAIGAQAWLEIEEKMDPEEENVACGFEGYSDAPTGTYKTIVYYAREPATWDARYLYLAFYKESPEYCFMATLPLEMIRYIRTFL